MIELEATFCWTFCTILFLIPVNDKYGGSEATYALRVVRKMLWLWFVCKFGYQ